MNIRRKPANLIILFLSLPLGLWAQDFHNFLQDDTLLRQRWFQESMQKKESLLQSAEKKYEADYKRIYEDQFKSIGDFWNSHRPVTESRNLAYLQKMIDRIIAANPELSKLDARVVISRDWWPNAMSMGDGTIALNAGLIVYFENEAQLAFVLCHELAHYYKEHTPKAIRVLIDKVNSPEFKKEVERISAKEFNRNAQLEKLVKGLLFNTRNHSRENEAEADALAFYWMARAGFDPTGSQQALELLDKVDDSLIFDPGPGSVDKIFSLPDFPFRKRWIQKESAIFADLDPEAEEEKNKKERDSLKTHPDCLQRIANLQDSMKVWAGRAGNLSIDPDYFQYMKKALIYEMIEGAYQADQLSRSFYYCLLLLGHEPENTTAIITIARYLNLIYEYQKDHKLGTKVERENRTYPESYNLLLRMIDRIRLDEILELNTAFCKKYYTLCKDIPQYKAEIKRLYQHRNTKN